MLAAIPAALESVVRHAFLLCSAALLPIGLLMVGGFFLLENYAFELGHLVQTGSQKSAGRLLALFVLGLMFFFLVHSVLSIAIGRIMRKETRGLSETFGFRLGRQEWRAFGANLRALTLMSIWGAAIFLCMAIAVQFALTDPYNALASGTLLCLLGALAIYIRIGILIPRTVLTRTGMVVRFNWSAFKGKSWNAGLAALLLSIPSLIVLFIGNGVATMSGPSDRLTSASSIVLALQIFERIIPAFVTTLALAYFVEVLLVTAWAMMIDLPDC